MKLLEIPINDSTEGTSLRIAKMYCNEVFENRNNYNINNLNARMKVFDNIDNFNELVIVKDIPFSSMCFVGKTRIQTPSGLRMIKDIQVGEEVQTFTEEGELETKKVTHKFHNKTKDLITIKTSRGVTKCTPNHPYFVVDKGWTNAEDLQVNDKVYATRRGLNHPSRNAIEINYNKELGYALGTLCSDGSITRNAVRLEVNEKWFAEKFLNSLEVAFNVKGKVEEITKPSGFLKKDITQYRVRIVNGQLVEVFKELLGGNIKSKNFSLPKVIFNEYEIFQGFFEAYIDGDGTEYQHPTKNQKYNRIFSANLEFMKEVSKVFDTSISEHNGEFGISYILGLPLFINNRNKGDFNYEKFLEKFNKELRNEKPFRIYLNRKIEVIEEVSYSKVNSTNVYNIEVEDNHTYIANSIWVHNCEHHFMPFMGNISVGYVPDKSIIGLSKIPRVVKFFSKKPQLQERLVYEIAEYLENIIKPKALFVIARDSIHTCVLCRGIESTCDTDTMYKLGDMSYKLEFLERIRK